MCVLRDCDRLCGLDGSHGLVERRRGGAGVALSEAVGKRPQGGGGVDHPNEVQQKRTQTEILFL